jgi:hypothetical protein
VTAPGPRQELPELPPFPAMVRGVVTALVIVAPAAVLNNVLIEGGDIDANSPATFLFWALILLGGAAGGWATIRLSPAAPLPYPAGAAALSYVLVQAVGVVLRLIDGDDISWIAYPFLALFMATCGMLGGMFARRWLRG